VPTRALPPRQEAGDTLAVAHLRNGQLTASYAPLGPHGCFSGENNTVFLSHFPRFCQYLYSDFAKKQHLAKKQHENGRLEWHPPSSGAQKWCQGLSARYNGAFLGRSGCVSRHLHHLTGKPEIATGNDPQTPHKPEKRTQPYAATSSSIQSINLVNHPFSGGRPPLLGFVCPLVSTALRLFGAFVVLSVSCARLFFPSGAQ
jgi:hypothetical protein